MSYAYSHPAEDDIFIDGRFTPEYLKALVWWMENKGDKNE